MKKTPLASSTVLDTKDTFGAAPHKETKKLAKETRRRVRRMFACSWALSPQTYVYMYGRE